MLNDVCLLVNSCLQCEDGRDFCIALRLGTKNGFVTIIPSAENHGDASTSTAKPNIHGSKVMPSMWWLGVVHYELLKPTETITGDRYRTQLMRLSRALKDKRPQYNERHDEGILQLDNARPHVAKVVKTYLETLKWEVLPHPLYSPDHAPSYYHLFRSMAHGLADQHSRSYEEVKNWIDS
ncbi:mariner Mos1 transposase [Trichonephila clavipes]|nr:mariner Mos1 transposase [Trichonephila clavipes]